MGEISEIMLDGTLCQECGQYIGPSDGYPRKCEMCRVCPECNGEGEIIISCGHGTNYPGYYPDRIIDCPECKGEGEIDDGD